MISRSASMRGPSPSDDRSAAAWMGGKRSSNPRVGWRSSCRPANGMSASNSVPRAARTRIEPAWPAAYSSRAVLPIPGSPRMSSRELFPSIALACHRQELGGGPDATDNHPLLRSEHLNLEVGQMAVQAPAINMDKLNAFMGQVVGELGATVNAGR